MDVSQRASNNDCAEHRTPVGDGELLESVVVGPGIGDGQQEGRQCQCHEQIDRNDLDRGVAEPDKAPSSRACCRHGGDRVWFANEWIEGLVNVHVQKNPISHYLAGIHGVTGVFTLPPSQNYRNYRSFDVSALADLPELLELPEFRCSALAELPEMPEIHRSLDCLPFFCHRVPGLAR